MKGFTCKFCGMTFAHLLDFTAHRAFTGHKVK